MSEQEIWDRAALAVLASYSHLSPDEAVMAAGHVADAFVKARGARINLAFRTNPASAPGGFPAT